jgi:hypothetical protein
MEDLTDTILNGGFDAIEDRPDEAIFECGGLITIDMLNRRPEIKAAILEGLEEYLVEYKDALAVTGDSMDCSTAVAEAFTDEQLINALNSDPYIQASFYECLNHLSDCQDNEGPMIYYPSILTMDNMEELDQVSRFREDQAIEDLPAKYAHLDDASIAQIYSNPELRQVVCGMPEKNITPAFIAGFKSQPPDRPQ